MTKLSFHRTKVFISYCHANNEYLRRLEQYLHPHVRNGTINLWVDTQIQTGEHWREAIDHALATAKVAILLVSIEFLASEFITTVELPNLLESAHKEELRIIPVIVTPCAFRRSKLSDFQALNDPTKPLSLMPPAERDLIWEQVVEEVLQVLPTKEDWLREGDSYAQEKQYEEAFAAYEQALSLDPQYVLAYEHKGNLLYELGRYEEALLAFQKICELEPSNAHACNSLANAFYHLLSYQEALHAYEHVLHLGTLPTEPYYTIVKGLEAFGVIATPPLRHGRTQDEQDAYWHYPEKSIYWHSDTGIHAVEGPIRDHWEILDWERGILGYPTTEVKELPDGIGCHCHFQHGCIYWSPETGAHEVHGMIRDKWASLGWEQSVLGYPVRDEKGSPDGIGRISNFQHGSIYWTPETEAHAVYGAIGEKWASLKWEMGILGYPIDDQKPTADGRGRYQHFQRGSIFWSPETGAHEVHGPIRDKWESLDWERGFLGYPIADQKESPDGVGHNGAFQGGAIYYTSETGAQTLQGPIFEKWTSLRGERGILRYPTSDQKPTPDGVGCYQRFQKGSIYWSPETGAHEVYGGIGWRWQQLKWERGILGYPTTGEMGAADGTGRYSHFQHGSIYWHPSVDTNAHEVMGAIREKWASLGWEQSALGYPISGETAAPDGIGRISYFQHGAIYVSDVTGTMVLKGQGQDLQARFKDAQEFALALEQARKPVPITLAVVVYHIDHPAEHNQGYYRLGKNLDANGVAAGGWSKPIQQSLMAKEHHGAGIALVDLDGNGAPDLIIFRIDHVDNRDRGLYRVGRNINAEGTAVGGWSAAIRVPDPFGKENLGTSIAVADLNRSGRPDLLIFHVECVGEEQQGFCRIGRDLDNTGMVTGGWGEPFQVPSPFGSVKYGVGSALVDLDGGGRPDLIIFYLDHQGEENCGYYRLGKHLDSNGVVTGGWSEPIQVPGTFGARNHGASIAIADLNRNGRPDLIVFYIEHPDGENRGYYRIGKNLDANGFATGGWSGPLRVPGWFGTKNQGAGIAFTTLM